MFFKKTKHDITFKTTKELLGIADVKESKFFMPDWYKNLKSETDELAPIDMKGTVKRCVPFRDAMQLGYIIPLWADIEVKKTEEGTILSYPRMSKFEMTTHRVEQFANTPFAKYAPHGAFKLNSPWVIKTNPNWSCLFVPPINHGPKIINIIGGLVDTDLYTQPINFPFLLDPNFEGIIPRGTPIAQVIPVLRSNQTPQIKQLTQTDLENTQKQRALIHGKMKHGYLKTVRCPFR